MIFQRIFTSILFCSLYTLAFSQTLVTISGLAQDKVTNEGLGYANAVLLSAIDSNFIQGTITDDQGRFTLSKVKPDNYIVQLSYIGYNTVYQSIYVGSLSNFLDIGKIILEENSVSLSAVTIVAKQSQVSDKMDKKIFSIDDNISQSGGSILQAVQNLPSVTVQDGKVQLRGNDKVVVLIDGKQTAITGFGNQNGLDNIPASAIEKIEIINNPSSKYDANGNAGIINIIYRKNKEEGWNGKIGLTTGLGSFWVRRQNLPNIRPQYTFTPKINPSIALNYKKGKLNTFIQSDYLYTETLNKNEFVQRYYINRDEVIQQLKRNRDTHFSTVKTGIDYALNDYNSFTFSGFFSSEKIIDKGDQPFYNASLTDRLRLWQFLEDELKTTAMGIFNYQHKFKQAGHLLSAGFNYTFHREDEKYYYDNFLPTSIGTDAFKLLSDEQVYDWNLDYSKPLKYGKIESGIKVRNRIIPTNMNFIPGVNSVIDAGAGGWATYNELIPAVYSNYLFENKTWEAELGLRVEYVNIQYDVNPDHPVYKSDGYNYTQPFPNIRFGYKINETNKLSLFYNRRVDRPNEVDIRIFPKYDDAEIIKVGNPGLRPQFTNTIELGYKKIWDDGSFYSSIYHKFADGTITRISSNIGTNRLIYAIFQNAGKSYNTGIEMVTSHDFSQSYTLNTNLNVYRNQINAFAVVNQYPTTNTFTASQQEVISGNFKLNNNFRFNKTTDAQLTAIYLAPDIIPQGKIKSRFSLDFGLKKTIQKGKGSLFINATDILSTMIIRKEINGQEFNYTSNDYYETQVVRIGYGYKI